jgi:hypothetical protein
VLVSRLGPGVPAHVAPSPADLAFVPVKSVLP